MHGKILLKYFNAASHSQNQPKLGQHRGSGFLQGTLTYNAPPNLFFSFFFISQVNFENAHILSETCSV